MNNPTENSNGSSHGKQSQLVLTFTHDTFALQIGGHIENLEVALSMLEQAHRELESKQREARAASSILHAPAGAFPVFNRKQ
jgi:hypothetical protein